jgi:hypothetical protein
VNRAALVTLAVVALVGCRDMTVEGLRADVTTGEEIAPLTAANWVSCEAGGCRFQGLGRNEGPDCVRNVRGDVRFATADSLPALDSQGRFQSFAWQVSPAPGANLAAGTDFTYVTVTRIPAEVVSAAVLFASVALAGEPQNC